MLAPRHEINAGVFTMKRGRFPPKHLHNIHQVALPFVASHESTFARENDKELRASAPRDALRKLQFIMHIICNAGERVDDRDGLNVMICKGTSKGRCTAIEKTLGTKRCPLNFNRAHGSTQQLWRK